MDKQGKIILTALLISLSLTTIPKTAKASLQTNCRDICNQISINARNYVNCSEINLLSISRDYYITNPCNNFGVCWTVMGNGQDCKIPLPEFIPIKNETIPTCNFENTTATIERCNQLSAGLSAIANNNDNCTRINKYYCEAIEFTQRNCSIITGNQLSVIMRNAQICKIPEFIIENIIINDSKTNLTEEFNDNITDNCSPIEIIEIINSSQIVKEELIDKQSSKKVYGSIYTEVTTDLNNQNNELSKQISDEPQIQNISLGSLEDYLKPLILTIDNNQSKHENLNVNVENNQSNQSSIITTFFAILAILITKLIFINK